MEETKVQLRDAEGNLTLEGRAAMDVVDDIMRPLFNALLAQGFSREEVMYLFVSGAHECYLDDLYFVNKS
jgi:hypothetical protein